MTDIGLTHIALPARSLEASVAFYARYANMSVIHKRPGVVWVSDRTRAFAVVLIETVSEIKPLLPMAHFGVAVASREEVDRIADLGFQPWVVAVTGTATERYEATFARVGSLV